MNNNASLVVEDPITKLNITQHVTEKVLNKFVRSCAQEVETIQKAVKSGNVTGLINKILHDHDLKKFYGNINLKN